MVAEKDQKQSYKGFLIWLLSFSAVMIRGSIVKVNIAGLGAVKSICVLMFVMLDLLLLLTCLTGNVCWMSVISYEAAEAAGEKARKKYAGAQLAVFLTATAVYLIYCFAVVPYLNSGTFRDSMTAGTVVCFAAVVSERISLKKF